MYNFGVMIVRDMEDKDKEYLEQNIQMAIQQGQIDLEDAMSIMKYERRQKEENERAFNSPCRKKRMKVQQEQMKHQFDMELLQARHEMEKEIEMIKARHLGFVRMTKTSRRRLRS